MTDWKAAKLLDGNAFGEVAGFVDVAPAGHRNVVGEELERDRREQREEGFHCRRQVDDMVDSVFNTRVAFGGNGDDGTFAGFDLFKIAEGFFVEGI